MEIAHDAHHADDVSYFANMIAIKQKRIDQLLQAQLGQDHRDNQKYKEQISRLKSNWDANSKQVEFINNYDLDTLTRTLNALTVMLETNDIAPQQWISALMQTFDPAGTSFLILQRHQHELDTCRDWPAVCWLVTSLLSKDMRSPGLSSILTEPVENTPIQSYILKLDADLKRPDMTKNNSQ